MSINKVAIITGASRGIGLAIARKLHQEGASVALCARTPCDDLGKERSMSVKMDVRDQKSVDGGVKLIVDRFHRIDIIVNNAGISGVTPVDAQDTAPWTDILQTNILGSYYVTRAAVPHMPNGGRVVMISSVLGKFGVPGYTAYCTAKTGLIGFTRALALELAPRKIAVNALCPGWTDTEMARSGMRDIAADLGISVDEFRNQAMSRVPLGEMVQPEEVANLVAFLASDAGKNITGQAISICGGSTQA
ncbi:MAG TPA: SDR family NAD(P)-dependent oxidoreductase [Terriglobia bacterium]|nr:SDR family NAD(P)-dependent oxidoreductase [Terriglobia bacterium]